MVENGVSFSVLKWCLVVKLLAQSASRGHLTRPWHEQITIIHGGPE
jgi:hypothetical protein